MYDAPVKTVPGLYALYCHWHVRHENHDESIVAAFRAMVGAAQADAIEMLMDEGHARADTAEAV